MKQQRMWVRKMSAGPVADPKSCFVQPEWRSWTCSARQRKYGIQPMSPSVSEKRNVGKRSQNSAHNNSTSVEIDIVDDSVMRTLAGASSDAAAVRDDDPTWQHRTVPSSQHARNSGSHAPEWIDGM